MTRFANSVSLTAWYGRRRPRRLFIHCPGLQPEDSAYEYFNGV